MLPLLLSLAIAAPGDAPAAISQSAAAGMKPAAVSAATAAEEAALRAVDDTFVTAFNKKDIEGILAYYADDAILMDPGPTMWSRGKQEIRKSMTAMFAQPGSMELKLHDASYTVRGNIAWVATLWTFTGMGPDGKKEISEGRAITVYEKRDGVWKAILDHASMPFPMPAPDAKK